MALHIPTLLVVSVFIFFLMSLLTFHAWRQETRERPLAYLGGMMLLALLRAQAVAYTLAGGAIIIASGLYLIHLERGQNTALPP